MSARQGQQGGETERVVMGGNAAEAPCSKYQVCELLPLHYTNRVLLNLVCMFWYCSIHCQAFKTNEIFSAIVNSLLHLCSPTCWITCATLTLFITESALVSILCAYYFIFEIFYSAKLQPVYKTHSHITFYSYYEILFPVIL